MRPMRRSGLAWHNPEFAVGVAARIALGAGLIALSACGTFGQRGQTIILPPPVPQATAPAKTAITGAQPRQVRPERMAKSAPPPAPQAGPATIAPHSLVGLSRKATTGLLGKPKTVTKNGTSLVWAYRTSSCTLRITFYPNIETKEFHALQYVFEDSKGKALNDEKACMRMLQRSKHDEH